ncbi:glycosyltransferase family 2 protein [Agrococcus sp. HG114]|uniref:glycosyltransferase family 2 protein n=1 Tax=Agrococcus sp. HG114 TaxID=2969757 RepID=UPI00215AEEFD|nr:glycosyltransferase family 2 protein [Agrococcus sp. HG114]MCR8671018.1 glycosyltransferase family 2 protein [Agrococcus sp. HG114]
MSARVSVALCTHEGERWIEEQLRSILAQSVPVSEVVVGDDASTDRTLDIVRRVASETDVPIRIRHHRVALGVAGNFADAIAATTGDVVALSDQDDVWHPDRLERLLPHLDDVALVHSNARLVDAAGAPLGSSLEESLEMSAWERAALEGGRALDALLRRNLVTGATALMRRDAAVAALPVPDAWIHDEWLAMCAALDGGLRYVPEETIDYRQHGGNAIGVRRLSLVGKLARVLEADSGKHAVKAARAEALAAAAAERGLASGATLERLVEKALHERARARLPRARVRRIPGIVRGLVRGRYRAYSRGAYDVARDLLEAHAR